MNLCAVPSCSNYMRYCRFHQMLQPAPVEKKVSKIKPVSAKRKDINKEYRKIVKGFLKDKPFCAIKSAVCTKITEGPHHMRGRIGQLLLDTKFMMPSCNACNLYVEENDLWARKNGFKLSKHDSKTKL